MRFSVITITRNNLEGLRRTHASLATQTCRDFEWIVIDGASNDGTSDFLKTAPAQWISEPDGGIYDAMNKGIDRAGGDYLLFLNAGDALAAPDVLENLASIEADFIYGDSLENGLCKPARSSEKILWGMFTHHQAMLYRRELIGSMRYDRTYRIAADYKFTACFLRQCEIVHHAPFPICVFEPGGVSQQQILRGRCEQFLIRHKGKMTHVFMNIAIFLCQSLSAALRRCLPGLYWTVRKRI